MYCKLLPEVKLALLVILVDAACDTDVCDKAAREVNEKRCEILDAYEREDKEAKRALRQEREDLRMAARSRLLELSAAASGGDTNDEGVTEAAVMQEMNKIVEASACLQQHATISGIGSCSGRAALGTASMSRGPRVPPPGALGSIDVNAFLHVLTREELTVAEAEISVR